MDTQIFFDLLRSDAHISVNKALRFAIGNEAATMFAELLSKYAYFKDRGDLTDDGYFYNTADDFQYDTNLTRYQQGLIINNLKALDLIDVVVAGIPAKRYFRINPDTTILVELLKKGKSIQMALRPNRITSYQVSYKLASKKLSTNKNNNNSEATCEKPFDPDEYNINHQLGVMRAVKETSKARKKNYK